MDFLFFKKVLKDEALLFHTSLSTNQQVMCINTRAPTHARIESKSFIGNDYLVIPYEIYLNVI